MKTFFGISITCLFTLVSVYSFINIKSPVKEKDNSVQGFAVIELFTSEGCSSCPPADEVTAEIQKNYSDKNVLVLGYHVDYWDRLGWKDTFSSADFTERQQYYAGIFNLNSIYTPQAVINGKEEFVGSDRNKLIEETDKAINGKPGDLIQLTAKETAERKIDVSYLTKKLAGDEQVVLLFIQKTATDKIKKGENAGKTLQHINIVRNISYSSVSAKTITLKLPAELKKEDFFSAALIQNKMSGKISAFITTAIN